MSAEEYRFTAEYVLKRLYELSGYEVEPGRRFREGKAIRYTLCWKGREVAQWDATYAQECSTHENPHAFDQYLERVAQTIKEKVNPYSIF